MENDGFAGQSPRYWVKKAVAPPRHGGGWAKRQSFRIDGAASGQNDNRFGPVAPRRGEKTSFSRSVVPRQVKTTTV
jgi:hypothetical protein